MKAVPADRVTHAGLLVVGATAAVMSFAALAGLAELAGTAGRVGPVRLAWLFPVSIDAYAATSSRVWLRPGVAAGTRAWARANALAAIALSVAGNVVYHELTAPGSSRRWVVVVLVAAVPPLMLGAVVHTAVLLANRPVSPQVPVPEVVPEAAATAVTPAIPVRDHAEGESDPGRRLELVSPKDAAAASRGEATQRMRAYWDLERAAGRIPNGPELDRVGGGTKDYGRRVRREWLREEQQSDDDADAELGG